MLALSTIWVYGEAVLLLVVYFASPLYTAVIDSGLSTASNEVVASATPAVSDCGEPNCVLSA